MKNLILILLITGLTACMKKEHHHPCSGGGGHSGGKYKSEGTITGADLTQCACCGGWYIKIGDKTWRAPALPENNVDLNHLPARVKLNWEQTANPCDNNSNTSINVTEIVADK